MNVVYMGTPEFARGPLATLADSRHTVLAVVTGVDKQIGRGRRLLSTPVKQEASNRNLPVISAPSLKSDDLYQTLKKLNADLFVVVAFRILPENLFSLPKLGAINVHASLLPKYRGAAPINWAIINGESETGLTSFFLTKEVDAGGVILQERTALGSEEIFDSLYARLSQMAGPFLLRTLDVIESGQRHPIAQDGSAACPAPKITPFNAMIDFGFPAENVRNFVRGLSTRPGAYTLFRGQRMKVLASRISETTPTEQLRPGAILPDKKRLLVQCRQSVIELTRVVPGGKAEMDGTSFINGFRLQSAEVLGETLRGIKEQK